MATLVSQRVFRGRRLRLVALIAGAAGLAACALGLAMDRAQVFHSYLAAYTYVTALVLGVLALSMIGRAMAATWVVAVRRLEEAVMAAMPALAVLLVPVLAGTRHLYPWVDPDAASSEHLRHLLHHKQPYLDVPFFIGRSVFYVAVWLVVAELLRRWSLAMESAGAAGAERLERRQRALSAATLPLVGFTATFAAFDWLMSLEPDWFSSTFGLYYVSGSLLGGVALLIVLAHGARQSRLLDQELHRFHFHALGRLLLTFVVFWAYIAYFQAMLIRMTDRPEEVTFFIERVTGSWKWFVYALVLGHFALPFLLLLPRSIKYRAGTLAGIAIWILAMCYLDVYWLVLPALHPDGATPHWLDLAALLGVGGTVATVAAWRQYGKSLLAEGHPRLSQALRYRSPNA